MPIQMSLPFLEDPPIDPPIRGQLDDPQRTVVLDKLAQLIAKTAGAEPGREESCQAIDHHKITPVCLCAAPPLSSSANPQPPGLSPTANRRPVNTPWPSGRWNWVGNPTK